MSKTTRGNTELLACVLIARQVQDGSVDWLEGCAEIAVRVIAGRVDPHDACALLAEVDASVMDADLATFAQLAHEQTAHGHLGFTAESTSKEIFDACRRIIARLGSRSGAPV